MKIHEKVIEASGFTLVEVLVTLAISGILMAGMYTAFQVQQDSYLAQDQVAEVQQNIRVVEDLMTRDLRMAGYNPTRTINMGFVDAATFDNGSGLTEPANTNATTISFSADLDGDSTIDRTAEDVNGDGNIDMSEMEQVSDRLGGANGTDFQRYSTTTGIIEWQTIAENIQALEFYYMLENGVQTTTPTAVQLATINSVQISLLARVGNPDRKFNNSQTYTPASGVPWDLNGAAAGNGNPPNDNFRRRFQIVTVKCRNMGL